MRTLLCSLLFAAASFAAPVNFSGKWAIQPAGGRGGPVILTLNQAGNRVTGTISVRIDAGSASPVDPEIHGGKADGDTLSFYIWDGVDQLTRVQYKATMAASGDEIALSVSGVRTPAGIQGPSRAGDPNAVQSMTAKRIK